MRWLPHGVAASWRGRRKRLNTIGIGDQGRAPAIDRWIPSVLRLHSVHPALVALIHSLMLCAVALPAAGAIGDWWPFGKRAAADETIPDPVEYSPVLEVSGPGADLQKKLSDASNLIER